MAGFLDNIVGEGMPLLNVLGPYVGWGAQNGALGGVTGAVEGESLTQEMRDIMSDTNANSTTHINYNKAEDGDLKPTSIDEVIIDSHKESMEIEVDELRETGNYIENRYRNQQKNNTEDGEDFKKLSIDNIKSKMESMGDFAPANRYKVSFGTVGITPESVNSNVNKLNLSPAGGYNLDFVQILCKNTELPGKSYATIDQRIYGPLVKRPFDIITTEITMTFLVTESYTSRRFFTDWIELIKSDNKHNISYYEDYIAPTILIEYLDKDGTRRSSKHRHSTVYGVKLKNAYPMAISPIILAYDSNDTIQEFTVTFTYEDWEEIEYGEWGKNSWDDIDETDWDWNDAYGTYEGVSENYTEPAFIPSNDPPPPPPPERDSNMRWTDETDEWEDGDDYWE